jgi:hypothetical protein
MDTCFPPKLTNKCGRDRNSRNKRLARNYPCTKRNNRVFKRPRVSQVTCPFRGLSHLGRARLRSDIVTHDIHSC